jgi:hypothetical protein
MARAPTSRASGASHGRVRLNPMIMSSTTAPDRTAGPLHPGRMRRVPARGGIVDNAG